MLSVELGTKIESIQYINRYGIKSSMRINTKNNLTDNVISDKSQNLTDNVISDKSQNLTDKPTLLNLYLKQNKKQVSLESNSSNKTNEFDLLNFDYEDNEQTSLESDSSDIYNEMDSYSEDITDSDTDLQDIRFTTSTKPHKPRRAPTYHSKQSRQNQISF